MSLYVRNSGLVPITLVAPTSPVVPAGGLLNVTGELRGLTVPQYTDLEVQRLALGGVLLYAWTTPAEFTIGALNAGDPWVASTTSPGETLDVAKTGTLYTSVAAAVNAITDASSTKPYVVRVFPGVYDEVPFTIPAYVTVWALAPWGMVVLRTTNNAAHFITGGPHSCLFNMALQGPTGAGCAAIHYVGASTSPFFVDDVEIRQGYYGVLVDPVAFGTIHGHQIVNRDSSVASENFIRCTGAGHFVGIQCSWMTWSPVGTNVGYYVSGTDAEMFLSNCTFISASTAGAWYADDGATLEMFSCTADMTGVGGTALHIGAAGANTYVCIQNGEVTGGFTRDLWVESATATMVGQGRADRTKLVITPGATITAFITDTTGVISNNNLQAWDFVAGHNTYMDGTTGVVHADVTLESPAYRATAAGTTGMTMTVGGAINFPVSASINGTPISTLDPAQTLDVAKSGAPYTSIKVACDAITTLGDSSATKPYVVRVSPGVYTEAPFTIPTYTAVRCLAGRVGVRIETSDNANHFITGTPGANLEGAVIQGPSGVGKAAIHYSGTGYAPFFLDRCAIAKGYYGVLCDPVAFGSVHLHEVTNKPETMAFQEFLKVIDHGHCVSILGAFIDPVGTLGATRVYSVSGATAELRLDTCSSLTVGVTDAVFADDGASVQGLACSFTSDHGAAGGNAIHSAGTGAGTNVRFSGSVIRGLWTKDIQRDTTSTVFVYRGSGRRLFIDYGASTANFSANVTDSTIGSAGVINFGETWIGDQQIPLVEYTTGRRSTGIVSGFTVSRHGPGSREVHVAAGVGFVADALGQIQKVTYAGGSKVCTASKDYIYLSVDETGTLNEAFSQPDGARTIYVTTASTDATDVVLLSPNRVPLPMPDYSLWQYNTDVIGVKNVSGGVVTQNVVPLKLDVTDSTFYTHYDIITSTGALAVTFTGWYRNPATPGSWVKVPGMTDVDDEQYDASGLGLQNIPAGEYARHTFFTAVNDSGTEYHMVYGQQTWAAPATNANLDPEPPEILDKESELLAGLVVLKSAGTIALIVDDRQRLNRAVAGMTITPTNDHNALINLAVGNVHTQYQLRSEKGNASGYCGLDATTKVAVANLDTATVAGATVAVGAAVVGAGPKVAFEDHNHSVSAGNPVAVTPGNAMDPGVLTSLARADHVHAVPAFGATGTTFCVGNDARLTGDRTANKLRTATTEVVISAAAAPAAGDFLVATSDVAANWSHGPFTFLGPLTLEDAALRTTALETIHGLAGTAYLQVTATGSDDKVLSVNDGTNETFWVGTTGNLSAFRDALKVGDWFSGGVILPDCPLSVFHNVNSYAQINMQNVSSGPLASGDYIATADNGTDTTYFVDLGIGGSTYNDPTYSLFGANDSYLFCANKNLWIGLNEDNAANFLGFFTRGTVAGCERMRLTNAGWLGVGKTPTSMLDVNGTGTFVALNIGANAVVTTNDARLTPATFTTGSMLYQNGTARVEIAPPVTPAVLTHTGTGGTNIPAWLALAGAGADAGKLVSVNAGGTGFQISSLTDDGHGALGRKITAGTALHTSVAATEPGFAPAMADGTVLVGSAGGPTALAAGTANTFLGGDGTRVVSRTAAQTTASLNAVTNTTQGVAVAVGASGTVLTSNGTAATWVAPVFGADFQQVVAAGSTASSTNVYVDKLTLTTGTLVNAAVYRVSYYAEVSVSNTGRYPEVRLNNTTDASIECTSLENVPVINIFRNVSGFKYVTGAGAAKTFILQFRSQTNAASVNCQNARIEIWRVS